ncbi:MAG: hypothetical protein JNM93_09315 [Bacteriovoracaceae bacterium]|nr:hypothetical protein [Bacteriovoracaceae bacterium]
MSENISNYDDDGDVVAPGYEPEHEEESRFKDGQILRFVRVRFPGHNRSYPFLIGKKKLTYGQQVMAMSDRGMAVGYVNSFPYEMAFDKSMLPIKSINKVANEEDISKQHEHYKKEKEYETICGNLITTHKLDMNLTHVEFTQFGKKVVFYFTAPARVDFRNLVKDLVTALKLRIELRQISVRDRAAAVGGIGPCGRQLCCSSFLNQYGHVNIKMAKNQNLTLTYGKLNGVCGQLKCCLQYEDEVYEHKRDKLPIEGDYVFLKNGDKGRVERLHLLSEQFDVLTDRGTIRRYSINLLDKLADETYKFPEFFEHISNETSQVVGLSDYESQKTKAFEAEIQEIKKTSETKAQEIFTQLFGEETFSDNYEELKKNYQQQKSSNTKFTEVTKEAEFSFSGPSSEEALEEEDMDDDEDLAPAPQQHQNRHNNNKPQHNHNQNKQHHKPNHQHQQKHGGGGGDKRNQQQGFKQQQQPQQQNRHNNNKPRS